MSPHETSAHEMFLNSLEFQGHSQFDFDFLIFGKDNDFIGVFLNLFFLTTIKAFSCDLKKCHSCLLWLRKICPQNPIEFIDF